MILIETLIDFLQEIIDFPDYKLSTSALQQQIQHLLFLVNITDCCSDLDNVIEEHKQLLVGYLFIPNNKYLTITFFQAVIKTGDISWDNVDYLCQWQSQILNNVKFSEELNRAILWIWTIQSKSRKILKMSNFSEEIEDNRQSEGITMETVTAQRNRNFQNDPKFSLNLFHLTWCSLHTGSHESKT